jgi:hypothetical protein
MSLGCPFVMDVQAQVVGAGLALLALVLLVMRWRRKTVYLLDFRVHRPDDRYSHPPAAWALQRAATHIACILHNHEGMQPQSFTHTGRFAEAAAVDTTPLARQLRPGNALRCGTCNGRR